MKKVLAIETSCDDTSIGIISYDDGFFAVEKLVAYSQIADHQKYGGVVPEIASRLHSEKIIALLEEIGMDAIRTVDAIAVTTNPGLPGSLVVGKTTAHFLSTHLGKSVLPINHIHGHIFSILAERNISELKLPYVVLSVSGGHNDIYLINSHSEWNEESMDPSLRSGWQNVWKYSITKLWTTRDDAAGECFDKVSRMLWGPYPGGVWISEKAAKGNPDSGIVFKRIFLEADKFDFSFSGMKSQVHYFLENMKKQSKDLDEQTICDIAYAFQESVVEVLANKLIKAAQQYNAQTIGIVWWVSANKRLREYTQEHAAHKRVTAQILKPVKNIYSTDNAAMIGVVGLLWL